MVSYALYLVRCIPRFFYFQYSVDEFPVLDVDGHRHGWEERAPCEW